MYIDFTRRHVYNGGLHTTIILHGLGGHSASCLLPPSRALLVEHVITEIGSEPDGLAGRLNFERVNRAMANGSSDAVG